MGADITLENQREQAGEPVADIRVRYRKLHGVQIAGDMIPRAIDEIPVLSVAASYAEGTTIIRDAAELRVKESDRIATMAAELRKMGAAVTELPDGMEISGRRCAQRAPSARATATTASPCPWPWQDWPPGERRWCAIRSGSIHRSRVLNDC